MEMGPSSDWTHGLAGSATLLIPWPVFNLHGTNIFCFLDFPQWDLEHPFPTNIWLWGDLSLGHLVGGLSDGVVGLFWCMSWHLAPSGLFSIGSAYCALCRPSTLAWITHLWKVPLVLNIRTSSCQLLWDRLPRGRRWQNEMCLRWHVPPFVASSSSVSTFSSPI